MLDNSVAVDGSYTPLVRLLRSIAVNWAKDQMTQPRIAHGMEPTYNYPQALLTQT